MFAWFLPGQTSFFFFILLYQDQNTSLKMEPENEAHVVFNSSLLNHEQEDKFLNIHLHSVSYEQWVIYGLAMPTFGGK